MDQSNQIEEVNIYPTINVILVTFNPVIQDLFDNLSRFCDSVKSVFLVDNSDDSSIREEIKSKTVEYNNIFYLPQKSNDGIGSAQNTAVRWLLDNKYDENDLLLFLDQDSYIETDDLSKLAHHLLFRKRENNNIIMLGATTDSADPEVGTTVVTQIISSGSIISLGDFKKVGYFDEELFIDFIDFAWCWKAQNLGYKIMIDHDVFLHHQTTGELKTVFGKGIDNPDRLYYVYRNLIISLNRYSPSFAFSFGWYRHLFMKAVFQIIVAEKRKRRTVMVLKGIWHGMNGVTGKNNIKESKELLDDWK